MIRRYRDNLYHQAGFARMNAMPKEAAEFCSMSLKIDPYFIEGLDLMAHLLVELGNFAEAEVYVLELLKIYPDFYEYHLAAADFYHSQEKYEKAWNACLKTLELDPGNPEAREMKKKLEALMN
jgi:tetratricopeptide (TPR) repeat protein